MKSKKVIMLPGEFYFLFRTESWNLVGQFFMHSLFLEKFLKMADFFLSAFPHSLDLIKSLSKIKTSIIENVGLSLNVVNNLTGMLSGMREKYAEWSFTSFVCHVVDAVNCPVTICGVAMSKFHCKKVNNINLI